MVLSKLLKQDPCPSSQVILTVAHMAPKGFLSSIQLVGVLTMTVCMTCM